MESEKMKTYPYIGKDNYNQVYLMLSGSDAITMDSAGFTHTPMQEGGYTNITPKYLANTYGEVVSPEHAEFIVELAELHGFNRAFTSPGKTINAFAFKGGNLYLYSLGLNELNQLPTRKITIPLPPKAEPLKNAGDNLVLGCESQLPKSNVKTEMPSTKGCKVDEWPKNGDKCISNGEVFTFLCKSPFGNEAVIARDSSEDWDVISVPYSNLKKPKTPEGELRDELKFDIEYLLAAYEKPSIITEKLLEKYNITKKPQ